MLFAQNLCVGMEAEMVMLRIAICDDEEKHLGQTAALLDAYL